MTHDGGEFKLRVDGGWTDGWCVGGCVCVEGGGRAWVWVLTCTFACCLTRGCTSRVFALALFLGVAQELRYTIGSNVWWSVRWEEAGGAAAEEPPAGSSACEYQTFYSRAAEWRLL